jgi:hypothetical protein
MTQIPEEISPIKIVNEYLAFKKVIGTSKATLEALEDFALYVVCKHIPVSLHPSTEWVSVSGYADMVNMIQGHKAAIEVLRTMLNKQGLEAGVNTANMMLQDIDNWERNIFPIGGFAPGNYSCKCFQCSKSFRGDKRAVMCLQCALKGIIPAPPSKP